MLDELLAAWDDGGGQPLRELRRDLHRYFERRGFPADDLTSRTLEAACKARRSYRGDCTFRTYLFGVARFVITRHIREQASRLRALGVQVRLDIDDLPADDLLPFELIANAITAEELRGKVGELNPGHQELVYLRFWEGLSEPELQQHYGLRTREAASGRLRLARGKLRRQIGEVCDG
jgi:RNA polymerase sigma factor (sigma-70 family)